MRIAGLDVSRNKVSVAILECIPNFKKGKKPKPMEFKADAEGIAGLLALEFDAAVMEPTGGHYSRIWSHHLKKAGRVVRWVGHWEVASYRESWKTFNKTDRLDAIALACYGLERWDKPWLFIDPDHGQIRDLYLQLEHLNRAKNPIVNRLRQQLTHEFPEVSERAANRFWLRPNPPGLWESLSGNWSDKWKKELQRSIGTGISDFTRYQAGLLCELERMEYQLELAIDQEMKKPEYKPYLDVFKRYGISDRTATAMLSVIYPIEKFLDDDRKPIVEKMESSNGKTVTRNRSLGSFKLACGVGMIWHQSGDFSGWVPGGRADTRTALWRWCKTNVVMLPEAFKKRGIDKEWSQELIELREYYDRNSGVRNQRVMRVVRKMLERLFRDLVREVF